MTPNQSLEWTRTSWPLRSNVEAVQKPPLMR
jgi:hypothetical protein